MKNQKRIHAGADIKIRGAIGRVILPVAVSAALIFGHAGMTKAAPAREEKVSMSVDGRRLFWDYGEEAIPLTTEDTLTIGGFQDLKKNGELQAVCVYRFETGETLEIGNTWENLVYAPSEDGSYIPFLVFENGQVRMLFEYSSVNGEGAADVSPVRMA